MTDTGTAEDKLTAELLTSRGVKKVTPTTIKVADALLKGGSLTLDDVTRESGVNKNIVLMSLGEMTRVGFIVKKDSVREGGKPTGKIVEPESWSLNEAKPDEEKKEEEGKAAPPAAEKPQRVSRAAELRPLVLDYMETQYREHQAAKKPFGGFAVKQIEGAMGLKGKTLAGLLGTMDKEPETPIWRIDVPLEGRTYRGFTYRPVATNKKKEK